MDDANDLVEQLLATVGGMLEDASAVAILKDGRSAQQRIDIVRMTCADAIALLDRAAAMVDRPRPART